MPFENVGGTKGARYYQEIAVNKTLEAVATNEPRILLTLATGTGKTFIAFQIAWKLFQTRWLSVKSATTDFAQTKLTVKNALIAEENLQHQSSLI